MLYIYLQLCLPCLLFSEQGKGPRPSGEGRHPRPPHFPEPEGTGEPYPEKREENMGPKGPKGPKKGHKDDDEQAVPTVIPDERSFTDVPMPEGDRRKPRPSKEDMEALKQALEGILKRGT